MISTTILILGVASSMTVALDCGEKSDQCLDVFSRQPSNLPKCYCTSLCEDHLEDVIKTCASGEVHADACGTCLTCAKARGQKCGGPFNVLGTCGSGLQCLIRINSGGTSKQRKQAEQSANGVCVSDRDVRCPRSGVTQLASNRDIFCRPGKLGIVADALYCPAIQSRRTPCPTQPPRRPPLLAEILGLRS